MPNISGNAGQPGAIICCTESAGNSSAVTSDVSGNYSFVGLAAGTYILIPSKVGFAFTPAHLQIVLAASDVTNADFVSAVSAVPNYVFTPVFSDTFTGPDVNPLDPTKWALENDPTTRVLQVLNGTCKGTVLNFDCSEYLLVSTPADQYARFTFDAVTVGSGSYIQLGIRGTPTNSQLTYNLTIADNGDGTYFLDVAVGVGISLYEIFALFSTTVTPGDVFTFAAIGNTLYLSQNNTVLFNGVDPLSTYASGVVDLNLTPIVALTDVQVTNFSMGFISSGAYSVPDCRVAKPNSATSRVVNGTLIYDVQTSSNAAVPSTDSRASGAPTDCRQAANIPQNSRTPGVYGPGE